MGNKRGRPTLGAAPMTPAERAQKSYAKKRETKLAQERKRLYDAVLHEMARAALDGPPLRTEAARKLVEKILIETEWAVTDGDPPK